MFDNPNKEPTPSEETIEETIARLALRNGKREALGPDLLVGPDQAGSRAKMTDDFEYQTNMAKSSAYLDHPGQKGYIKELVIIPDGPLADAGRNQINMTVFAKRFLNPTEWSEYFSTEDEGE